MKGMAEQYAVEKGETGHTRHAAEKGPFTRNPAAATQQHQHCPVTALFVQESRFLCNVDALWLTLPRKLNFTKTTTEAGTA
jgi:hypothetical protein